MRCDHWEEEERKGKKVNPRSDSNTEQAIRVIKSLQDLKKASALKSLRRFPSSVHQLANRLVGVELQAAGVFLEVESLMFGL